MDRSRFERTYMEKSWKDEKHQAYKIDVIDDSIRQFDKFLKTKNIKGRLLDLGCGNGKNTIFFEQKGFKTTGIDFSESAIKICMKNALKNKSKPTFLIEEILDFRSKTPFDVIIDCGCLHHIRKSYWKEYQNMLVKNIIHQGYYYIHAICDCQENKRLAKHPKKRNWIINKKGHYTHFISLDEIRKTFGKNFNILKNYKFKSQNSPLTIIAFYMQRKP